MPRVLDRFGASDITWSPPEEGFRDERGEASGGTIRPFQGFGLSVERAPNGARVVVDGVEVGETPLVASIRCTPRDPVHVEVRKPPYPAQRRVTACRADALIELSIDMTLSCSARAPRRPHPAPEQAHLTVRLLGD